MTELPQFRTVLRGYDPDQVTAAIAELTGSLTVARRTAAQRTMELTRAQQRVASLSAELDDAVARLVAGGTPPGDQDSGPTPVGADDAERVRTEVRAQLAALIDLLADQEAALADPSDPNDAGPLP